jgi:hypothetical protein
MGRLILLGRRVDEFGAVATDVIEAGGGLAKRIPGATVQCDGYMLAFRSDGDSPSGPKWPMAVTHSVRRSAK